MILSDKVKEKINKNRGHVIDCRLIGLNQN
jgi:hypothetical protein